MATIDHRHIGRRLSPGAVCALRLYVSGASPKSFEAIKNVTAICDGPLSGRCRLEVVDIYQHPERATRDQVVAVPMLVKHLPLPIRRVIGTLNDPVHVLKAIGLANMNLKRPDTVSGSRSHDT